MSKETDRSSNVDSIDHSLNSSKDNSSKEHASFNLSQMKSLLWPLMRPHKKWLFLVILAVPIGVLAQTLQPLIIQKTIDGPIAHQSIDEILEYSFVFVMVVIIGFLFKSLGVFGLQIVGLRSLAAMRRQLFTHVLSQGQRFFDARTTGSLMTRTTNDVEAISESITRGVAALISDGLLIISIIGMMIWLNPLLTLIAFSISPILIWVVNLCRHQLRVLFTGIRATLSELNGLFAEYIHGVTETQRYGAEEIAKSRFDQISMRFMKLYHKANWWDAGLYAIMDGLSSLSVGLVIAYVAYQMGATSTPMPLSSGETVSVGITSGDVISVGIIVAFIDALNRVYVPIREFSGRLATIQRSMAALDRILALSYTHEEIKTGEVNVDHFKGEICFKDVSFKYTTDGPWILKGLNLQVSPGEVVALVGATGSGKSTIARLLLRNYEGYEGEIEIDGQSLQELNLVQTRDAMVAVHQDPYLFKATIAENIHLWDPSLKDQIKRAAQRARADHFIQNLPLKYETHCTANGGNLSAGQRQLITIARAFIRASPIVILDEATASVDTLTEQWIDEAISELFTERTVLVIAHRLSTIAKADRILMLREGRVVEEGSHEQLILQDGLYAELVRTELNRGD